MRDEKTKSKEFRETLDEIGSLMSFEVFKDIKVYDAEDEKGLQDTVESALKQIEMQKYEDGILAQGIQRERIRKYGFAFEGKRVLIG